VEDEAGMALEPGANLGMLMGRIVVEDDVNRLARPAPLLSASKLKGNEKFPATGTITLGGIGLSHEIKGEIELE
jgi:Family of unknown function (DUF6494)